MKLTLAETPLGPSGRIGDGGAPGGAFERVAVCSAKATPWTANHPSVVFESELDEKRKCVCESPRYQAKIGRRGSFCSRVGSLSCSVLSAQCSPLISSVLTQESGGDFGGEAGGAGQTEAERISNLASKRWQRGCARDAFLLCQRLANASCSFKRQKRMRLERWKRLLVRSPRSPEHKRGGRSRVTLTGGCCLEEKRSPSSKLLSCPYPTES